MATARIDLDCELDIDPTPMITGADHLAGSAWQTGAARYADGTTAEVHFRQGHPNQGHVAGQQGLRAAAPDFPRTSTGDQFYGELDFEAYRQLGLQATGRCWTTSASGGGPTVAHGQRAGCAHTDQTAASSEDRPFARTTDQTAAICGAVGETADGSVRRPLRTTDQTAIEERGALGDGSGVS
jgi:hypothetical protein